MEIIKTILDNNLTDLKSYLAASVTNKVDARIASKKIEALAKRNGLSVDKMTEQLNVSKE